MGTTTNMPPIYRLRAFLAARRESCEQCHKAPKQAAFDGYCSGVCLESAIQMQAY